MKQFHRFDLTTFVRTFFCIIILSFLLLPQIAFASPLLDEYNYVPLYFDGYDTGYQACTIKGNAYIPIDALKEYGDCTGFAIDEQKKQILFTPAEMDLFIGDEETTAFIQQYAGTCYYSLKTIDRTAYVSLNLIRDFCDLSYTVDEDDVSSNKNATAITCVNMERASDSVRTAAVVRRTAAAGSLFDADGGKITLKKGQEVYVLGSTSNFYQVRTFDGDVCYVSKSDLGEVVSGNPGYDYIYTAKKKDLSGDKFNMVWFSANASGVSALPPDEDGVDVVAPVWLHQIVNGDGNVESCGDRGFVDLCHERNKQVWICLTNDMTTKGSTNYTSAVLADEQLRRKTVAQYLFYACLFDADGLNIDYEDVLTADGSNLTLFTAELYEYCSRLGLVLSSDVLIPTPGNLKIYQYDKVIDSLDYLCAMTYDQHWSSSPQAGSVSDQTWYTQCIEDLLQYCPGEKLLMGVPFYTRIWNVDAKGNKLGSTAVIMDSARIKVSRSGITPVWLPDKGQYYIEYTENGKLYRIWLEDKRSIATRLSNVYYYGLAGTCCWRYGQQEEGILQVFDDIYHCGGSPGAYTEPY
ncbi:MAG: hypothetical protein HUJ80_02140 [Firmicutes bacterium]|nr:hypothetical protein [Bacillota bacterium]